MHNTLTNEPIAKKYVTRIPNYLLLIIPLIIPYPGLPVRRCTVQHDRDVRPAEERGVHQSVHLVAVPRLHVPHSLRLSAGLQLVHIQSGEYNVYIYDVKNRALFS